MLPGKRHLVARGAGPPGKCLSIGASLQLGRQVPAAWQKIGRAGTTPRRAGLKILAAAPFCHLMLTIAISGLVVLMLAGVFAIVHSAKHAVTGYEDASGFHEGVEPGSESIGTLPLPTVTSCDWDHDGEKEFEDHPLVHSPDRPIAR